MLMRRSKQEAACSHTAQVLRNTCLYLPRHCFNPAPTKLPLKPCLGFSLGATHTFLFFLGVGSLVRNLNKPLSLACTFSQSSLLVSVLGDCQEPRTPVTGQF